MRACESVPLSVCACVHACVLSVCACVCVCCCVCVVVFNETVAVGENRKNEEGLQAGDMMSPQYKSASCPGMSRYSYVLVI